MVLHQRAGDLGSMAGLDGLSFYSNSLQLHGASGLGRALGAISTRSATSRRWRRLPIPLRDHELSFDISWGATIVPGWIIQPNQQRVFHPGGQVPGNVSLEPIRSAVIVGVRSTMRY
jgi:hypothetical protein